METEKRYRRRKPGVVYIDHPPSRYIMEYRTVRVGPPTFEVEVLGGRVTVEALDDYMRAVGGWEPDKDAHDGD